MACSASTAPIDTVVAHCILSNGAAEMQGGRRRPRARYRSCAWKDAPEPQGLVARPRHDGLPIWGHREVHHTITVARQNAYIRHAGVLPQHDLVLRIAMCADNLVN